MTKHQRIISITVTLHDTMSLTTNGSTTSDGPRWTERWIDINDGSVPIHTIKLDRNTRTTHPQIKTCSNTVRQWQIKV